MKLLILIAMLALAGCASTAPPACAGDVRRVNPPAVSVSEVVCPWRAV